MKTTIKRPSEIDPADFINWEIYDCPHCDGGLAKQTYPDSDQVDWETCDECNGEGELAILKKLSA